MKKTVKGDLIKLAIGGEFDVIVHGCNCFHTMGGGIAKTIKKEFPEAYCADLNTSYGQYEKLGGISIANIEGKLSRFIVVNGYTQFTCGGGCREVDYDAVRMVFRRVKETFSGARIGYPAIGSGLAGGDWKIISKIIDDELAGEDHTYVEFVNKLKQN